MLTPRTSSTRSLGDAGYLLVAVAVALLVFAAFGLLVGRAGGGSGTGVGAGSSAAAEGELECIHALGLPKVLGDSVSPVDTRGTQVFHIDATGNGFEPNNLAASAGAPIEIVTSEGRGCTRRITFERPAVTARLDEGETTLRLPTLEQGVYPFECESGLVAGLLVVR